MDKFLIRSDSNSSLNNKRSREDEPEGNEDWQLPKRTAIQRPRSDNPKFSSPNRFSSLTVDQTGKMSEPLRAAVLPRKNPKRVPPIIIAIQDNWTHRTIKNLIEKFDNKFHLQYKGQNRVAVQCYSIEAHQLIKDGLRAENIQFHTFTRKDERFYKVVIKGLPADFEESLVTELDELGFNGAKVTKLASSNKEAAPCPPFLVQLPAGTDISNFKQIKYIANCAIEIRRFKSTNSSAGTQCFRCQSFGHAARNCNLPVRCVKCTDLHASKDCPKKDRTSPARCCNCLQDHPASYSKCTERIKYLSRLQEISARRPTLAKPPTILKEVKTIPSSNTNTWANVVSSAKPTVSIDQDESQQLFDDSTKQMLHILTIIKTIRSEFINCKTMIDKVVLVLTHLGQYV